MVTRHRNIRAELEALRDNRRQDGNTSKADGASLALGSSEYREYVYDQQGLDEFEQTKAIKGRVNYRSGDVFDIDADVSHEPSANRRVSQQALEDDGRLSTAERKVSHQIHKDEYKDDVMRLARARAARTATLADDRRVERYVPGQLEAEVYDDGVTDDEFYPGAALLRKYC